LHAYAAGGRKKEARWVCVIPSAAIGHGKRS
jgi:hypothetical protein